MQATRLAPLYSTLAAVAFIGGTAGLAHAQSSVTVYGLLDTGIVHESGGKAGPVTGLASGIAAGSRLGFRGVEDLGGGLSALFLIESGIQIDTGGLGQGNLFGGRQTYVGLKSQVGTVTAGLQYTPYYLVVAFADPFVSGLAGKSTAIMASSGTRMDNTVKYRTPTLAGFTGEAAYRFGETAGSASRNSAHGATLSYANGPLDVRLAHHSKNIYTVSSGTAPLRDSDARNTMLAGTYDFTVAKAYLAYAVNKGFGSSPFLVANPYGATEAPAASTDSRDMIVGVSVPYGASTYLASYIRKDDRDAANRDASKWAVGYFYALSPRTSLYASYSAIRNTNGAAYTVATAIESGTGDKASNIGITHSF